MGKVAVLETRGRRTGAIVAVAVGFVEEPDGSLLVCAGRPDASWASNLIADPAAVVRIAEKRVAVVAEPLDAAEHARAVRELILRYGTPAERLGTGPSVRLRPVPGSRG